MQERMIGSVRVTRVPETTILFPPDHFFPEFDAESFKAHEHWLVPEHYDALNGMLVSSIQSWLVRTAHHTVLIDACIGAHKHRPNLPGFDMLDSLWLDRLERAGARPEEIDFVMCTHLHVDHVGWNTRLDNGRWVPTFPNAKYLMSRRDYEFWTAELDNPDAPEYQRNVYNDSILPVVAAGTTEQIEDGYQIDDSLTVRGAYGHTPGHVRVDLDAGGERAIFAGDALHNAVQVPLWEWNSVFCNDRDLARETRHDLLAQCADAGALLIPAHFGSPYVARIASAGESFRIEWSPSDD